MPRALPRDLQALAGQTQSGTPLITHDPASVSDIQVVETIDVDQPSYVRSNYGDTYPGLVSKNDGSTLYSNFVLVEEETLTYQYLHRIWQALPGSWIQTLHVDPNSDVFIFSKARKNIGANIRPFMVVKTGSGATVAWTVANGAVTAATITGGTGYADFFGIQFLNPAGGGAVAQGYGTATNGIPNAPAIITFPGTTYSGSEGVPVALPGAVVNAKREDINSFVAWEIVTVTPDSSTSRSWNDIKSWSFPYVLKDFQLDAILDNAGNLYKSVLNYFLAGGYNGPVPVVITQSWTASPPASESPTILVPRAFFWDLVSTSGSVPKCLHTSITIEEEGGGGGNPTDPAPYLNTMTFAATSPTTLPTTMILDVNTVPYNGGYLKTKMVCTSVPDGGV